MHSWDFVSHRFSHLPPAALLCIALVCTGQLAGCDRPSASNTNTAKTAKDNVVAYVGDADPRIDTINGIPFLRYYGVDISPDGSHYAVMHKTQYGGRLDIDGVEGMTGQGIFMPVWSPDGKSYGYRIGNQVVINGQSFGPYKEALNPAFSPVSKSWAFLHFRRSKGVQTVYLVRDGVETALTANATQVNFDPKGNLIFMSDAGQWLTNTGQPATPPAPIRVPQVKTGIKDRTLPREGGSKLNRVQLTHNGKLLGTFDAIPTDGRLELGYLQPDGRVLLYGIANDQLHRFFVTPKGEMQGK